MMKYLKLSIWVFAGLLTSCSVPQKLYEEKAYDEVILKLSPKLCDGNLKPKNINLAANAFHKANKADHERILELKATGKPDIWPEVYHRYMNMKGRTDALKCLPVNVKNTIHYMPLDLDDEIVTAQHKAENYLVAEARTLLKSHSKEDARQAIVLVERLENINPSNKHLPNLRQQAILASADNALVIFDDNHNDLPSGFAATALQKNSFNDKINFDYRRNRNVKYDMLVVVKVLNATVSPEKMDDVTFVESRDDKSVKVTDHTMNKTATVKGVIEFIDYNNTSLRAVTPFQVNSVFNHVFTTIKGDKEACSDRTLEMLKAAPVPFPTDDSMLLDAAQQLNKTIAEQFSK